MNHRLSITTAAVLATLALPSLAQDTQQAAPTRSVQAVQNDQGVIELSNRAGPAKTEAPVEATTAPALNDPVAATPALAAPAAPEPVVAAAPTSVEVTGPKGVRQYAVAALAALGVVLFSMLVLGLVRGSRRRRAERANPPRPLDISKRHIILSREMSREAADDDSLPEAPPPASIRTPIVPASSPTSSPLMVAESRTPTVPPSQPRPASKPTSDLAAAMLRATAQPPPFAPAPPPPASQRQWLSQRPAAVAKESR